VGGKLLFNKSSTTFLINSTFGNYNWKNGAAEICQIYTRHSHPYKLNNKMCIWFSKQNQRTRVRLSLISWQRIMGILRQRLPLRSAT